MFPVLYFFYYDFFNELKLKFLENKFLFEKYSVWEK